MTTWNIVRFATALIEYGIGMTRGRLVGIFIMRKNWRKLGIEELQYRYNMSKNMAETFWESAYRKSLRRARRQGVTANVNISREVYSSTFYRGTNLFDINFDEISPDVDISKEFTNVDNLESAFVTERFRNMGVKYEEVQELLNAYRKGEMSYSTFLDTIRKFKKTNREYLSSKSG